MARFFFHLHECGTVLEDFEGRECDSLEHAHRVAIDSARDVLIGELQAGRLCLDCFIAITNGANDEVERVPFRDAVLVTGLPRLAG